jgi:hypothetical protein
MTASANFHQLRDTIIGNLFADYKPVPPFELMSLPPNSSLSIEADGVVIQTNQSLRALDGRAGSVEQTRLTVSSRRGSRAGVWRFLPPVADGRAVECGDQRIDGERDHARTSEPSPWVAIRRSMVSLLPPTDQRLCPGGGGQPEGCVGRRQRFEEGRCIC